MTTRRSFIQSGLSAAALGLFGRRAWGRAPSGSGRNIPGGIPQGKSSPFNPIPLHPQSVMVEGLPFASWYTGDDFVENGDIPFHGNEQCFAGGQPPLPTEDVELIVVGGGISGLSTAYLLRDYAPVVFELHDRFGGSAQGEYWAGTHYSLGNAYVITPDAGTFLEDLYRQLGLQRVVRVDEGDFEIELNGKILDDFFAAKGQPPEVAQAFLRYREVVLNMANVDYPDIPLPDGKDNQWILDLDKKTFRADIEQQMGMPVPDLLAAAVQAYCYSSFGAGWEEISAASGWNFLAAEEFGRWVFPGGNAWMAQQFWHRLTRPNTGRRGAQLHGGSRVVDVRLMTGDKVLVTYLDSGGQCRSMSAKRVVMCCSKMIAKHIIHDLSALDEAKVAAMEALDYRAYVVVNVLLNAPIERDFYDIFLLGDGNFPMSEPEAQANSRVIDMLSGHFARGTKIPRSVLTLYWPLPFNFGRWTLLIEQGWQNYTQAVVPQVHAMLATLKVKPSAVRQVRMTRWGHAMPIARPGLIANGVTDALRRPIDDRIYFVNQDNWALPAVENCLLDAEIFTPEIAAGLTRR